MREPWPSNVEAAAARWLSDVTAAFVDARDEDTLLVRYEDLAAHPDEELPRVWAFLGLDDGLDAAIESAGQPVEARTHLNVWGGELRAKGGDWGLPEGFSFARRSASHPALSPYERWCIERTCRVAISTLNYDPCSRASLIREVGFQLRRNIRRARRRWFAAS